MWQRAPVATAIAGLLGAIDPSVSAFATPPETLNPPAYVCAYPRRVEYNMASLGVDLVTFVVSAFAGPTDPDTLDDLLSDAAAALNASPTLAGSVQEGHVSGQDNWRRFSLAGAEVLAADLTLEIRM
jgi:hypothetical protein